MVLKPNATVDQQLGVLNPGSTRLRDGTLQLYPRMVAPGNISRIGSFETHERDDGVLVVEPCGYALQPEAPYEFRSEPGGYGCEDPRVTYIAALERYVMPYIAFGAHGPDVGVAISDDGFNWKRLGLLRFGEGAAPFADKDAAFFPEPVLSPAGVMSLAFYHRPTLQISVELGEDAVDKIEALAPEAREGIAIGYIPLADAQADPGALCSVAEMHRLELPPASWGSIKVGAGTPPVRIAEGWLSVIHGVDRLPHPTGAARVRYCAGLIVHDAEHLDRVLYRSYDPLFVPELPGELSGTVGDVVFPTAIDPRGERAFDIYYGMADYRIGRGRLTLPAGHFW